MRKLLSLLALLSLPIFGQNPSSGTITASGSNCSTTPTACVILLLPDNAGTVAVSLSGTFSATLQFEATADYGTTWVAASGTPPGSTTTATSATAAGTWRFPVSGLTGMRVRGSSYASGTAVASLKYSSTSAGVGGSAGLATNPTSGTVPVNSAGTFADSHIVDSANFTVNSSGAVSSAGGITVTNGQAISVGSGGLTVTSGGGVSINGVSTFTTNASTTFTGGGVVQLTSATELKPSQLAVASLPSASGNTGGIYVVTDSTAISSEGQTCAGSSTNTALAFSNGSIWKCF